MRLFLIFLSLVSIASPSAGSTPQEEYKKIQEKLSEEKKRLSEALERESSVLGEIDRVNLKLSKTEEELRQFRKSLRQTEAAIGTVSGELAKTKQSLEMQKKWMERKLRSMNRFGYGSDVLMQFLSVDDLSGLMRSWKYLEYLARYEHGIIEAYRVNITKLDEEQKKLEALKAEMKTREKRVRTKENELAERKREKETILTSVRTEKKTRQNMISELREASRRLQDIIAESSKKEDYAGKGFGQLKGRLFWPAEGHIVVPYGAQKDAQFDTPVFRNGIHIETEPSADARAVFSGKVIFAEWFKGFGQLIIVNHGGGYHTLYGNLAEIFSKVGDIIRENSVIGKVGTSGTLNAPGIYFEIRYKGKPLDPSQWLKKKKHK
jgi:septal ring factor EnvC (AmiA/AmiB activator)